jgi:hypothetical protein
MYGAVVKMYVGLLGKNGQSERGTVALKASGDKANRLLERPTRRKVPFVVLDDVIVIDD